MNELIEKLKVDQKDAMKRRVALKEKLVKLKEQSLTDQALQDEYEIARNDVSIITQVLAELTNKMKSELKDELTEKETAKVLKSMLTKLTDERETVIQANRDTTIIDAQIAYVESVTPESTLLNKDQTRELVQSFVNDGLVFGEIMKAIKMGGTDNLDMALVSKLARELTK